MASKSNVAGEQKIAVPRDQRDGRIRLHLLATLATTTRTQSVVLRNISAGGAMIETQDVPAVGSTVQLKRGALDILATIVWAERNRCGMEFVEPIDADRVVEQWNSPPEDLSPASRDHFWRLREVDAPMSATDWRNVRDWAADNGLISKN